MKVVSLFSTIGKHQESHFSSAHHPCAGALLLVVISPILMLGQREVSCDVWKSQCSSGRRMPAPEHCSGVSPARSQVWPPRAREHRQIWYTSFLVHVFPCMICLISCTCTIYVSVFAHEIPRSGRSLREASYMVHVLFAPSICTYSSHTNRTLDTQDVCA